MADHTIARLKQEAEKCFLSTEPTTVEIPTSEAVIAAGERDAPTLNKSFVAAVNASVARPGKGYLIGMGWKGEHHGGPLLGPIAGTTFYGEALGHIAMHSEVTRGLQGGGREFHGGYAVGAYYVGYLLALRHGTADIRRLAARALVANLAIDYLLTSGSGEVVEIGGRATGGRNIYAAMIQRLWAGDEQRAPDTDAATSVRMFANLTATERLDLPEFPQTISHAVQILRGASVTCPADFEWWGWADGRRRAQVNRPRAWFIDKRTGPLALGVAMFREGDFQGLTDGLREYPPAPDYDWHLALGEGGLTMRRSPHDTDATSDDHTKPSKPAPPPRPEPGTPSTPAQEVDLLDEAVREWARSPHAPKGVARFREELLRRIENIRGVPK